jgi:hypothetical protein
MPTVKAFVMTPPRIASLKPEIRIIGVAARKAHQLGSQTRGTFSSESLPIGLKLEKVSYGATYVRKSL